MEMNIKAVELGEKLVKREKELDELFASKKINNGLLNQLLRQIGAIRSELRFVHLQAHLRQREILTQHQILLYDLKRGYADGVDQIDHSQMMNH